MTTATQSGFEFNERYMRVLTTVFKKTNAFNATSHMNADINIEVCDIEACNIEARYFDKKSAVDIVASKKNQHIHLLFLQGNFNVTSLLCKEGNTQCWPQIREIIEVEAKTHTTRITEDSESTTYEGIIMRTIIAPVIVDITADAGSLMLVLR